MGLLVTHLRMHDFRCFAEREVDLAPGTTVLVGPNAVGKTNTVEALQLLTAGTSFRHPTPVQMVREGAAEALVHADLEGDGRVLDVECHIAPGRRDFRRNGKRCQAADVPGTLMSVLFSPDDLSLVKRGASGRRDELDDFGRQAARGYAKVADAYRRGVEQRNRLLKDPWPDPSLLDAWDASVAVGGATLLRARLALWERLAARTSEVYGRIGGEELRCEYVCSLGEVPFGRTRDEIVAVLAERLAAAREEDLRRQQTTVGPHRDDVRFLIAGRDARNFGSQGQQRSVVLALKMAEVGICAEVVGEQPLLLLDDVMSELDATRREAIMRFVGGGIQTVVTTTNLGYFSPELLDSAEVVAFDG